MTIPLHIKNARIWDSEKGVVQRDLYTANGRIVDQPATGAQVVDLEGYTIFPGLINAHDHLELNHYPRSKFRDLYANAHQWGEDMNARLDTEPYKSLRAYPLRDRLFIGGLKNLLCGATTVAHHGPPHKPLFARDFPVRVLKNYGWAHSLHFNTDQEVVESYHKTPKDWPWFVHLAEGTDEVAASEYRRLKALGCVGPNTVIVHGVGITDEDIEAAGRITNRFIWCPSTNEYLLGKSPEDDEMGRWRAVGDFTVAIGSDSRLTADGDLLRELRAATWSNYGTRRHYQFVEAVTVGAAQIIDHPQVGNLHPGSIEDLIVLDFRQEWYDMFEDEIRRKYHITDDNDYLDLSGSKDYFEAGLCYSHRADLALVVKDGIPRIGDPELMAKFPQVQTVAATLDGVPKAIHIDLARRIHQCTLKEPGLEVDALPTKRFWLI